jgi:RNA polymerase sigma factor (sigma-70 family)
LGRLIKGGLMTKKDLRYDVDHKRHLFEKYKERQTKESLAEVIDVIKDLIYKIILKTIKNKNTEQIEDIFNNVICEIIPAIKSYDPIKGSVSSFLYNRVRYEVIKSVNELNLIRIPDYMFEKLYKINKFIDSYVLENEKYPDIEKISKSLKIPEKDIQSLAPAIYGVFSLDFPYSSENGTDSKPCMFEKATDVLLESVDELDNMVKKIEVVELLNSMVAKKKLKEKSLEMLVKYYFDGLTYEQIAQGYLNSETGMPIKKQAVEQYVKKAKAVLKKNEKLKELWVN